MIKSGLTALLLLVFSSTAWANFTVEQSPEGLIITPAIAYQSAAATLDGPYGMQQLSFTRGQQILIPLPRLDGGYKYQVVLTPVLTPAQIQARDAARQAGENIEVIDSATTITSGSFAVISGGFALPLIEATGDLDEDNPNAPVIPDPQPRVVITPVGTDGVIGGSLCVGFDCPPTPNFGFDTYRLQENNLRIHFDDTSTPGGFPSNDWRLLANDTGNGGDNLFALEDSTAGRRIAIFEAGAPANSLFMDSAGDIGLATDNPVVEFHIADGDSPTVRLEQNGSAGFGAQTWDLAGNESNFFIRDVSNGSQLSLRIRPGADTDSILIDSDGQVSVGGSPPMLDSPATLLINARNATDPVLIAESDTDAVLLTLQNNGDMLLAGTLAQLSRRDSKEHFTRIDHQAMLAALKGLDISTWNYKHQPDSERHLGPVAEEFHAAYGLGTNPQHIATSDMAAVALASSQALLFELEAKEQQIAELEDRLQRLEALMVKVLKQEQNQDSQQIVNR